jgi:hypothetical protein
LEKVRDATAELAGLPRDWAEAMPEHMQVQAPFVMPGKQVAGPGGQGTLPVAISPALPLTDLNLLPIGKDGKFSFEAAKNRIFTSITPFLKVPAELAFKYDTFYRDKIRKDFVPAPSNPEVRGFFLTMFAPLGLAMGKGVPSSHKIRDRRADKMVDGWPWWVDKLVRQVPLQAIVLGSMTEGRDKRPGDKEMAVQNYLSGFRQSVIDPDEGILAQAWDDFEKLESQINRAKEAKQPHESLKKRKAKLQKLIYETSRKSMAEPYFAPTKRKKKSSSVTKWTGSGSSWKDGR